MESYALVSKILGHASHSAHCKHLSASTNPVMVTHQTPEPCYRLDPGRGSPHLSARSTPDDSHCGRRTGSTPPPQAAARSVFSENPGVGHCRPQSGMLRRRRGCSECLCPLCCRSRTQARSPTRPPAPAQCHCFSLWENGGGKRTGPARPAPQGQGGGDEATRRHLGYGLRPDAASPPRRGDVTLEAASWPDALSVLQQVHSSIRRRLGRSR